MKTKKERKVYTADGSFNVVEPISNMDILAERLKIGEQTPVLDAVRQGYLTLIQARPFFKMNPTHQTIINWMKIGVCRRNDEGQKVRVKLQSVREGAAWLTRPEWIHRFTKECGEVH